MKTLTLLFAAMLCGPTIACLSSDDDDTSSVEQEGNGPPAPNPPTINCNDRTFNATCSECNGGVGAACCPAIYQGTCTVTCDNWNIDPRTGKRLDCQI